MINQMYAILRNAVGDQVALNGPIYLREIDGIGMVAPTRYTKSGPQQDGQTLGQALFARVVTLGLDYWPALETDLETQRETLQQILNDLNHEIWLDLRYPSGRIRRLDVYYYDGLTNPRTGDDLYANAKDALQLIADNPILYDPTPETDVWPMGGGDYYYNLARGLFVPLTVPFGISASTIHANAVVVYPGTWQEYPIWHIYGPASHVCIENLSTGEVLQFTEAAFVEANDIWTIDLRYGHKDTVNLAGINQNEFISTNSDMATWHLGPHAEVYHGRNSLRILASDCNEDSKIEMTWYKRYVGG